MLDFFQTIIEYVQLLFTFILNMVTSTINLLTALVSAIIVPQIAVGYVFAPLGACILAVVAFSVVKLILGRGNV